MRFDKLSIPAFGPFTDYSLKFDRAENASDIHLIYGPNEAGKSSLLRAISQMLYGIPARSTDTFLHDGPKMLTGATISEGKKSLSFLRKKGNKNTLLDADQSTISEESLKEYLGAIDESFFQTMFGLDTDSLRAGARELLSGTGQLATILFSASLGGNPIDTAIKNLEQEADQLFKPTARKNITIIEALSTYKEHEKLAKSVAIKPKDWALANKDLTAAKDLARARDEEYRQHQDQLREVQNLLNSLPAANGFKEAKQKISELNAPNLPSDYISRVRDLHAELRDSQNNLNLLNNQLDANQRELKDLPTSQAILDHSSEISALSSGLVSYLDKLERLEALCAEANVTQEQLSASLESLEIQQSDLDTIPITTLEQAGELEVLAANIRSNNEQIAHLSNACKKDENRLNSLQEKLSEQPDSTDLASLESLQDLADLHAKESAAMAMRQHELESLVSRSSHLLERLKLTQYSDTDHIHSLRMISEETVAEYQLKFSNAEKHIQQKRDALELLKAEHLESSHKLQLLTDETPIFSSKDLRANRIERDQLWQIIKNSPADASQEQLTELDAAIQLCDTIVDALHHHAQEIAKAKDLQQNVALLEKKSELAEQAVRSSENSLIDLEKSWAELCLAIPLPMDSPMSPNELNEWRKNWLTLCSSLTETQTLTKQVEAHKSSEQKLSVKLQQVLNATSGDSFSELHSKLRSVIKRANQQQGEFSNQQQEKARLVIELGQTKEELEQVNDLLDQALKTWSLSSQEMNLDPELSPETALNVLNSRSKAHQLASKLQQQTNTITQLQKSTLAYQENLHHTADVLLTSQQQDFSETIQMNALSELLSEAQEVKVRRQSLNDTATSLRQKIGDSEITKAAQAENIRALYQQADIENDEQLESLVISLETKSKLETNLNHYEETLKNLAVGKTLEEIIAEVEDIDLTNLKNQLAELENNADEILAARDLAKDQLREVQSAIDAMETTNSAAADHKQTAANALSSIITDTERYIKLQHAIDFLNDQVEAYRKKTQGPMIDLTSHYFRRLTNDNYKRVIAQLDDKNIPQLLAVRDKDETVSMAGLSEGTADQLYLALRLAAIDLHLDKHPPIPLILDDLLMTFDDERVSALLPVLEELSKKTQILIFTHHNHLIELATPNIQTHQLSKASQVL